MARVLKVVSALAVAAASLALVPAGFAESATSPTGVLSVSVPPPVVAGLASPYTLTFTNNTSSTMTGITASGNLPSGMTLKGINGCARLGGNQSLGFLCTMPNLAPGASEQATFSLLASGTGTYDVPFTVSGAIPGANFSLQITGDSVTLPVSVQPGPTDIQVTGSSNNGSPPVGSPFNYTFQVKNNGPLPAFGVTFDDPLPASMLLGTSVTVDNGTCAANAVSNTVHCDIGDLGVGQQSDISFSATPTAIGAVTNTASIAMLGTDTHPANNSVGVTVQPK